MFSIVSLCILNVARLVALTFRMFIIIVVLMKIYHFLSQRSIVGWREVISGPNFTESANFVHVLVQTFADSAQIRATKVVIIIYKIVRCHCFVGLYSRGENDVKWKKIP